MKIELRAYPHHTMYSAIVNAEYGKEYRIPTWATHMMIIEGGIKDERDN